MTSPRLVWSEGAEVAARRQQPHLYWCVTGASGTTPACNISGEQRRRSAGKNTLRTRARKIAYEGPHLLRLPHRYVDR
jgi:hypothetical protein